MSIDVLQQKSRHEIIKVEVIELETLIIDVILKNKQELVERWLKELQSLRSDLYMQKVSEDAYEAMNRDFMNVILETLQLSQEEANERLSQYTETLIREGMILEYFIQGLQAFKRVLVEMVIEEEKEVKQSVLFFTTIDNRINSIVNKLIRDFSGSWENIFELQKMSLLELSAPLIPVFENISVMPLIGTIDTSRAKLIMENLLEGVIKHRSEVVLIDITGVPVVDTMVAHHIIQAAEAVRLVGSKCILVGIRPEIAQTIVNLGIDLSNFPTKSTLKKGIETALQVTNKQIVNLTNVEG